MLPNNRSAKGGCISKVQVSKFRSIETFLRSVKIEVRDVEFI